MKTDLFQSCVHCWVFQICWHIECSTFTASSFRIWNSSAWIPSPPLALFVVMLSFWFMARPRLSPRSACTDVRCYVFVGFPFYLPDSVLEGFILLILATSPSHQHLSLTAAEQASEALSVFYQYSVAFWPLIPGRTFPGCCVPCQRESAQMRNLLWLHFSDKDRWEGDLSGSSHLISVY